MVRGRHIVYTLLFSGSAAPKDLPFRVLGLPMSTIMKRLLERLNPKSWVVNPWVLRAAVILELITSSDAFSLVPVPLHIRNTLQFYGLRTVRVHSVCISGWHYRPRMRTFQDLPSILPSDTCVIRHDFWNVSRVGSENSYCNRRNLYSPSPSLTSYVSSFHYPIFSGEIGPPTLYIVSTRVGN